MTFRDQMNRLADRVRGVPQALDERTTSVTVRTVTWLGGRRGVDGGSVYSDLVLTPRPKVREVSQRDIASSAGRYTVGDVKVGPITPAYPGGGYTVAQLDPTLTTNGLEVVYVLDGGVTGEYARVSVGTDRSHSYFVVLRKKR